MSRDDTAISRHGDIIIVKRPREEEEGSHGGVWKIAFADFMTALMAFFLVMWLTNASDDATKRRIAQYFNPIKLNSSTPPTPGLDTGDTTPVTQKPEPVTGTTEVEGLPDAKPVGGLETGGEDQAIFRDPYAVLAEIVATSGAGVENGRSEPVLAGTGLPGLNGGDAYRDPFDPASWQLEPHMSAVPEMNEEGAGAFATVVEEIAPEEIAPAETEVASLDGAPAELPATPEASPASEGLEDAGSAQAEALEAEIRDALDGRTELAAAGLEVEESADGLVISLADSLQTGMFEIGSDRPNAETILLVEKVAAILSERAGSVVIRGHTDARPYSGENYDNWQLSTARAHMAYYMLLRGGLDAARVDSIEGFADRKPKNAEDPNAAENRRIEILLRGASA